MQRMADAAGNGSRALDFAAGVYGVRSRAAALLLTVLTAAFFMAGCGAQGTGGAEEAGTALSGGEQESGTGLANETAADGTVDFAALQAENPDIFAWLYVPGTDIDGPVLQSVESDTWYEEHGADGSENADGAFYTELANLTNLCDFNTVIHGKTLEDGGMFSELHRFADSEFFDENQLLYLYLPDNVLMYEIYAAYTTDSQSLIRKYDFTYMAGCQQFIDDLYDTKDMSKNLREGWEEITPYNFLVTLTTNMTQDEDRQFLVVATLINDAAGTIDRAVYE